MAMGRAYFASFMTVPSVKLGIVPVLRARFRPRVTRRSALLDSQNAAARQRRAGRGDHDQDGEA
jgi:hypothetical protein